MADEEAARNGFSVVVDGGSVIVNADYVEIEGAFLVFEREVPSDDSMVQTRERVAIIGQGVRVGLVDDAFGRVRARVRAASF